MGDGVQEATSAQIAEVRGRAEATLAVMEGFGVHRFSPRSRKLAHDVLALADQVAELRVALQDVQGIALHGSPATGGDDSPWLRLDAIDVRVLKALARPSHFEGALTPGRLGRLVS